jgi:RNA polymerase sigma-70 factor (ECF subfamily)
MDYQKRQLDQITDEELVKMAVTGLNPDRTAEALTEGRLAFNKLAIKYYGLVYCFLLKRVHRQDVAEDLAQETFLHACDCLKTLREPSRFGVWLFGIANNLSLKWFRRGKHDLKMQSHIREQHHDYQPFEKELEEQKRINEALESSYAKLPEDVQQMLHMKHHDGLTVAEIAARIGQPVGTVKSRLWRVYRSLRQDLENFLGEPNELR